MISISTIPCPVCGKIHTINVNSSDYARFLKHNGFAQECFPYLKPEEREMLISGICPDCWDKLFVE